MKIPFDWDEVHSEILGGFEGRQGGSCHEGHMEPGGEPSFQLSEPVLVRHAESHDLSYQHCPLGASYLGLIGIYSLIEIRNLDADMLNRQADRLSVALSELPMLLVAGSRWPIYEALQHFRKKHRAGVHAVDCVKGSTGIEWGSLLHASGEWVQEQMLGFDPGEGTQEKGLPILAALQRLAESPQELADAAQEECIYGFLFLCAVQVVAAAGQQTGSLEAWSRAVDRILQSLPFFVVLASQWPIFEVLAILSVQSKGPEYGRALGSFQADVYRWGSSHPITKRFRSFGDLRLHREELLPFGFHNESLRFVEDLSKMEVEEWHLAVGQWRDAREMRPSFKRLLDSVMQVLRASTSKGLLECGHSGMTKESCYQRGCLWSVDELPACQKRPPRRKLLLTSFVWGREWSQLLPSFIAWMDVLKMPTVLVAMGKSCRAACEVAAGAVASRLIACWDPFSLLGARHRHRMRRLVSGLFELRPSEQEFGSILQRHALVHLLLHLGVDVRLGLASW